MGKHADLLRKKLHYVRVLSRQLVRIYLLNSLRGLMLRVRHLVTGFCMGAMPKLASARMAFLGGPTGLDCATLGGAMGGGAKVLTGDGL